MLAIRGQHLIGRVSSEWSPFANKILLGRTPYPGIRRYAGGAQPDSMRPPQGRNGAVVIITRSPLRISLGGGGTDLPSYYLEHGGFVISAAIDRYVYITLHEN